MATKQDVKGQHTPGPWTATNRVAGETDDTYWQIKGGVGFYDDDDPTAGFCMAHFMAPGTARLIAASPAMLKALKRLVAEREDDPERYPLEPTCNQCTEGSTPIAHDRGLCHWHEARAAIAAAEGRTNG